MYRDCGWVRIGTRDSGGMIGRGHLYLRNRSSYGGQTSWTGSLDSIHLDRGVAPLNTGYYVLYFESGPDVLTVRLDRHRMAGPGAYSAAVESAADNLVPLGLEELAVG